MQLDPGFADSILQALSSAATVMAAITTATVALVLYVLPSIIALSRRHPNRAAIVVLNLFLGWFFVGWVVSLALALTNNRPGPGLPGVNSAGSEGSQRG